MIVIHAGLVVEAMGVNSISEGEIGTPGTLGFEGGMEKEEM